MRKISLNGNKIIPNYDILTKCQNSSVLDQHEVLEKNEYSRLGFEGGNA